MVCSVYVYVILKLNYDVYINLIWANKVLFLFFFFFKQKTAYEMLRSLVGSEMCIRDSYCAELMRLFRTWNSGPVLPQTKTVFDMVDEHYDHCLLYASDAADDLLCVDLGGRRIIKKKKLYYNQ